ncbi:hypothetical protein, partial [Sansalvadorimonas verongulae]|uniref:hypothetical protein n=1 Tax=Sansalvadorimonas verongulae TaxID=2172824 RepID=UPI0012BCF015
MAATRLAQTEWPDRILTARAVREQKKATIYQAFEKGEMVCRGVNVGGELSYQKAPLVPRPGTLLQAGKSIKTFHRVTHLGLFPVRGLYPYKRDIFSDFGSTKNTKPRDLLPDRNHLLDKLAEQDNRLSSLYLPRTSGRLGMDGRHISGHNKSVSSIFELSSNEFILEGYRKEQYQCVIVALPITLDKLYQKLQDKFCLERELDIAELPLVF